MQFIPGETLGTRLKKSSNGVLPVDEVLDLGIKLCNVLSYLHSHNPPIIFSDLKPDNIMLTPQDDLYLIDFGIARLLQPFQEDERKFVSLGYSAPEQFERTDLTPRADIYSLGATLYYMLSGRHPAVDAFSLLSSEASSQLNALNRLIKTMVAQREEERPLTINAVMQEMQHIPEDVTHLPYTAYNSLNKRNYASNTTNEDDTRPSSRTYEVSKNADISDVNKVIDSTQRIHYPDFQVRCAAWSPNGNFIAVADDYGNIQLWLWSSEYRNLLSDDHDAVVLQKWSLPHQTSVTGILNQPQIAIDDTAIAPTLGPTKTSLAWSPDGVYLVATFSSFRYRSIFVLDTVTGDFSRPYQGHSNGIRDIIWSPDGVLIASTDWSSGIHVWDAKTGLKTYQHQDHIVSGAIAWSPDGTAIASAGYGGMVHIWEAVTGKEMGQYRHTGNYEILDVIWSSDGSTLVSCGKDKMIHVWDTASGQEKRTLEGHTAAVSRVVFLNDDRLLLSVSEESNITLNGDNMTRIWRTDTWTQVATIDIFFRVEIAWGPSYPYSWKTFADVHPIGPFIAGIDKGRLFIWELDVARLLNQPVSPESVQYTNAKVVLVGDSGVGKSGLGLVLSQQTFAPTESTHGRVVWTFAKEQVRLPDERREVRETLLWDLAGQAGYRLIHQLHLHEVAVALVVFDAHSETDPFAGIAHWVRALQVAQRIKPNAIPVKKLLVLARMDRGGKRVSRARMDAFVQSQGFDGYFETSAKQDINIAALHTAIRDAIDWEVLPRRTSTQLFQRIKEFLLQEKQAGRLLSTLSDLERAFLTAQPEWNTQPHVSQQFAAGVGLVDAVGFISHLSFGGLVLLQPELLDGYASALVNAARDEPDGLGHIPEQDVYAAMFPVPADERIRDSDQERLLLIAMVENLLRHEIALREQSEEGSYLVFPSETTRENPALPDPENVSVIFTFAGPVLNIYATLAVRLSHSGWFVKNDLWKNAMAFTARIGGMCGMMLKVIEDGLGSLTLFFDGQASEQTRLQFEDYVHLHLKRKALPENIQRRRTFVCERCGLLASEQLIRIRRARNLNWYDCSGCGTRVWLLDREERLSDAPLSRIHEMDRAADDERDRAIAQSTVQGKQEVNDFDTFLCYHPNDRERVLALGRQLKEEGLLPWLDEWELRPGLLWQQALEQQIEHIRSAVVCVGRDGIGPWQELERAAFLREFVNRRCPIIPVLLPDAPAVPSLPVILKGFTWVDFRRADPDPLHQLTWGITGKKQF